MVDPLLFGRLGHARCARPRRFRLFNAHLDEYLRENDVKSRFHFGRDSINYLADLLSDDLARNTAFHLTKNSGANFRKFPWANGIVFFQCRGR